MNPNRCFKSVCLATALFFGAVGGSQAQSYSVDIQAGENLIANQLDHGSNTLNEVMPDVPDGSRLSKYNNAGGTWDYSVYSAAQSSWLPNTITLNPGDGAVLHSPTAFTLTFEGLPHFSALPIAIPSGAVYLLSRQTNEIGDYTSIVGNVPMSGASLYQWTGSNYTIYTFTNSIWSPSDPMVRVGEAVWVSSTNGVPPPFYIVNVPAGESLIANQLDHGSNTVNEILPDAPDGCTLSKYNNAGGTWDSCVYNAAQNSWQPNNVTLKPGEGAVLQSPAAFAITVQGTLHVPVLPITIPNGAVYLLSRQINDIGNYDSIVGSAPINNAALSQWTGSNYTRYTFASGVWSPATPTVPVGQSVWISRTGTSQPPDAPGVYVLNLDAGDSLIANQLDHGSNTLSEVLPHVPDGSVVYKYNNGNSAWTQSYYNVRLGAWIPNNFTLNPGEGAVFECPTACQLVFTGRPHVPVLPVTLTNGAIYLLSRQTNDIGNYGSIVGISPQDGALIFRGSPSNYASSVFVAGDIWYDAMNGDPEGPNGPSIPVGQAAWFTASGAAPGTPPALPAKNLFLSLRRLTNGYDLFWNSNIGTDYQLQASTNLFGSPHWTTQAVVSATAGTIEWLDSSSADRQHFYRVSAPSP